MNSPATTPSATSSHALDALTGGVFSAPTSGERAARVRDWLATSPSVELMNEVFKELSHRDRGASKPLKEKLDELKRQKNQEHMAAEWADKGRALIEQPRLNLADAMAWQRDAARAGAPLSREPLASLKQSLGERVKAIEDLQHRVQVEREAAVLIAQRIEVLSTKPWREALTSAPALGTDVAHWTQQVEGLLQDAQWPSVDAKFTSMLEGSRQQLQLVWDAFEAALAQASAADADAQAPLPAVPVWADELRQARGQGAAGEATSPAQDTQALQERRARAIAEVEAALATLDRELAQGHGKATPKVAGDVRSLLKNHGRHVGPELEARAHAALAQAGELEGWQRWRADQLREELVAKAEGLLKQPEGQRLGGRKLQETLRGLREQWKATDQGGQPNHALWKRFDEACTEAHKQVEAWLVQVRQQAEAHKAERMAIIEELKTWTAAHADDADWKLQIRELHRFSERWRAAGHLSEKAFAELQPLWKDAMHLAHARLEAAQAESTARRRALIEDALALGAAPLLRVDAVKALQQRWQAEAHAVPLERKQEQKLWEAFRQPIDEAFARKDRERDKAASALSAHDQRVLNASKALEAASASGDAQQIRSAMQALEQALADQPDASIETPPGADGNDSNPPSAGNPVAQDAASAPAAPAKKLVAVRGDDRPGMKKAEPPPTGRDGRRTDRPGEGRRPEGRGRDAFVARREDRAPRGPRLGDVAFRAQRQAVESAQASLRKLAAQAHGEVLTQLMRAWETRDGEQVPSLQTLGSRVNASARQAWVAALTGGVGSLREDTLLRLEMAAEVPTPAEHLSARRMLQLQLLTSRHAAAPEETWVDDVRAVLQSAHDEGSARRLQSVLKVLLKR